MSNNKTHHDLLMAGLHLFADHGYSEVSNRKIAATAGANQALIGYHFGSKEGLYYAVFEYIAKDLGGKLENQIMLIKLRLDDIKLDFKEEQKLSKKNLAHCKESITQLVTLYAGMILEPKAENYAKLIIREQLKPTKAFEILWENGLENVLSLITGFLALLKNRTKLTDNDKLTALTLMGQVLVFRVARATVNKHMGWSEPMTSKDINSIISLIQNNLKTLFNQH